MTRALITGCTGCLGSNLAMALSLKGIEVVGLSYKNESRVALQGMHPELLEGNVLEPESLRPAMRGVDWVFHVAGIADDWNYPPEPVYRTNVLGTYNVLKAAQEAGVKRFVLTASAAITGIPARRDGMLMDENDTFNLPPDRWIYGHTKVLAEQVLLGFVAEGMHACSVMPTALMGPGDHHFITGSLIKIAAAGELFPFPNGGSNFIDVRDAAAGHIAAAERGIPGERYILGAHNMTHVECLKIIGSAMNVPVRYIHMPDWTIAPTAEVMGLLIKLGVRLPMDRGRAYLSQNYMYYDNQKAVRELGLKTRPFSETVLDAYNWYIDHNMVKPPKTSRKLATV